MIIAGTGHRPNKLGGYGIQATSRVTQTALRSVLHLKPTAIITGMALGWDQALATVAIDQGIPFYAYIPFKGQEKMWPAESQDKYHRLLDKAQSIKYVCDPGYAPWKMQARNEAMVYACDRVLALWNGSSGGTANCVNFARAKNKPITNAWKCFEAQT